MLVRYMQEADVDAVCDIENATFSMPWSHKSFVDAIKQENNVYIVAEDNGEILGYAGMWTVLGEAEITNVAVKDSARRKGVADAIMDFLINSGRDKGLDIFFLEVRESNVAAQKLYEKHNFLQIGTRKNFYERPVENAIVMSRTFFSK